jgi:uncharacterized protein YggE
VVAAALLVLACVLPAAAQNDGRIRVIGRATVEAAPDHVTVRIGVASKAPTPTAALDQNSAAARKIIDFSKRSGIDERDIQTDAINLTQAFKTIREPNGNQRQEPDGYSASNAVRVTLSDLARLGTFMRQVLDQGATNIGGVQFGLSTYTKAIDEARSKAVEDAARQARLLAQATGVKLGRIQDIQHPPRAEVRMLDGAADLPPRRARVASVPVEAGVVQVVAEVEITWLVEP